MGDLAEYKYGLTASANDSGAFRLLRITDIDAWGKLRQSDEKFVSASLVSDEYVVKPGDILMARTGATFGKTMLVTSSQAAVFASYLIRIRFKEGNLDPTFYWHFAQSSLYWSQANAIVSSGGQPQFNANALKVVRVPLPPLDEQLKVASLLDNFDTLVNDLSIGLPAELNARRKQYEHYRDRLLTFDEAA